MKLNDSTFFENTFKYSPIGMAIVSLTGDWLLVNPAICTLLGYSREELLQMNFQKITFSDDLNNDFTIMNKLLSHEISSYQMEKRYINKKDEIVWGLLSVSLIKDDSGNPHYFIAQILDLTDKKKKDIRIAEAEKLATLHQLSVILAHEVNNPLTIISMNCEIIGQILEECEITSELSRQVVAKIKNASERIELLIKDLKKVQEIKLEQDISFRLSS